MKAIVVYYSLSGHTEYAAETIARKLGAEIVRLEPKKPYPRNKASAHDRGWLWRGSGQGAGAQDIPVSTGQSATPWCSRRPFGRGNTRRP